MLNAAAQGTFKKVKRLMNHGKNSLMTGLAASSWPCEEGRLSRQELHRAGVLYTRPAHFDRHMWALRCLCRRAVSGW